MTDDTTKRRTPETAETEPPPPPTKAEEAAAVLDMVRSGPTIRFAETEAIEEYQSEADEICDALERLLGIRVGFLSDMSSFGDFQPRDESDDAYFARISEALGVAVQHGDSIVAVCKRLRRGW